MWRVKMRALWLIFKAGMSETRARVFNEFKQEMGDRLESYATWCLCYDKWGAPKGDDCWERTLTKDSDQVRELANRFPDTLEFYRWLEWVAFTQLHDAQVAARNAGMKIGIMSDMAVGVHPAGSEVWWNPERFANGATVGAPPDYFNQQGQDWSQPPLSLSVLVLKHTEIWFMECLLQQALFASTIFLDFSAYGGFQKVQLQVAVLMFTTMLILCLAFWQLKPLALTV